MKNRHKTSAEENFPVGSFFISRNVRHVVHSYYLAARYADDIADNPRLQKEEKLRQLDELENIFNGFRPYRGQKLQFLIQLRKSFQDFGLDASLYTDLLQAFRQDAKDYKYDIWEQLTNYCSYSAAPVGRFLLALHNESPSACLPANALCAALQIVNHLQDIKYDVKKLKRIYLPAELMKQYKVVPEDLSKNKETVGLRNLINDILCRVEGLLEDARLLPSLICNLRLKIEISIILSLTNCMIKRIKNGDVLQEEIRLSKTDRFFAVVKGLFYAISTKRKTLPHNKGL